VLKAPLESAEVAGHTVVLGLASSTHVGSPFCLVCFFVLHHEFKTTQS